MTSTSSSRLDPSVVLSPDLDPVRSLLPLAPPGGTALVLAGGGVAGIAWETGVLLGLRDADADLGARVLGADLVVGTSAGSAGSAVGAQIATGVEPAELYAAQLRPETSEISIDVDLAALFGEIGATMAGVTSPREARRRIGALALAHESIDPARRHRAVAARLSVTDWPARALALTAVDADTGDLVVHTRDSGVGLVDAVTASCAVPGVWPVVDVAGRRLVDGGARSMANADLAVGAARVLVISPSLAGAPEPWGDLQAELRHLAPAAVHVISADEASITAFGPNPLSPATRAAAARAGRDVGRAPAAQLRSAWA